MARHWDDDKDEDSESAELDFGEGGKLDDGEAVVFGSEDDIDDDFDGDKLTEKDSLDDKEDDAAPETAVVDGDADEEEIVDADDTEVK